MPGPPLRDCGICAGSGLVSQVFFDRCQIDGLRCLPVGSRCYCTVTDDEVEEVLPELMDEIMKRMDKS